MRKTQDVDRELLAAATQIRRGATALAARARASSTVDRRGALSPNQTAVLGQLHKGGEMTPGEVAARLGLQPQSLTRTLAALEDEGWLRRTPDPADGRQSLLGITATGRRVLGEEMAPRDRWLAGVLGAEVTPAEREVLVIAAQLMERIAGTIGVSAARVEP